MNAERVYIPAGEVRVGDLIELTDGREGTVAAIRDHRGDVVSFTVAGLAWLLHREDHVRVTLEDDGR